MHRPLPPLFFVGLFLLVVIAAVLMLAQVMSRQAQPPRTTPRAALELQLALLQKGDPVGLRLTCVESLRPDVTEEAVARVEATFAGKTLDDLVGSVEDPPETEEEPPRRLVLRPDGTPLTRLRLVDGSWLTETLWFLED